MNRFHAFAPLAAALALAGCFGNESSEPRSGTLDGMTIMNDEAGLKDRVTDRSDTIQVDTVSGSPKRAAGSASHKTLTLTLVAEIAPPVVNGDTLQASSVALKADFAYVSYNFQGAPYRGGVDVIQLKNGAKAEIRSSATFDDADVHSLYFDGDLYLAEATSNDSFASPAVLERVVVNGGKLVLQARERVALNSFAATAVTVSGTQVYATSGNTGGLHALANATLAPSASPIDLTDARWVDADDARVVVARGTPGRLSVFTKSTLALQNTWTFTGANAPEAKTTVRVIGGKALVAAGSAGAHLLSLATGKVLGTVPRPVAAGLDTAVTVANAADADKDLAYVSFGEAGVYAVQASSDLSSATGEADVALTVLGKLRFAALQSVNHVAFDGNTLVVAAGKGGVKVVSVKWQ